MSKIKTLLRFIDEMENNTQEAIENREEFDEYDPIISEEKACLDTLWIIKREIEKLYKNV